MKDLIKKDLFGFPTQGKNYELYRPKYSKELLQLSFKHLKNKNRYLDVAVGTGQILYQICNNFKYAKGIDISPKMLDVCRKKLEDPQIQKHVKIQFQEVDFMSEQLSMERKYDLITIGQALHWLPVRESLEKMKNMIEDDGTVAIYGYALSQVRGQDLQKTQKYQQSYYQFYDQKVKRYFNFDRDELHTHYKQKQKYPFEQIFNNVERSYKQITVDMPGKSFASYLQTYSGYNTYVQHKKQDPISIIKGAIPAQQQVQVIYDYFVIVCGK